MNKLFALISGTVLGGLISAVAVLLLTPKSGDAIRSDIKHEVDVILEEGRRAMQAQRREMEAQLAEMRGDTPPTHDKQQ
jgi:gas vesicle protein